MTIDLFDVELSIAVSRVLESRDVEQVIQALVVMDRERKRLDRYQANPANSVANRKTDHDTNVDTAVYPCGMWNPNPSGGKLPGLFDRTDGTPYPEPAKPAAGPARRRDDPGYQAPNTYSPRHAASSGFYSDWAERAAVRAADIEQLRRDGLLPDPGGST